MLPQFVSCDECDERATVCGHGRIEFDWPDDHPVDAAAKPQIRSVRLTVDCPRCGLRDQDHFPNGIPAVSGHVRQRTLIRRLRSTSSALRS